jgi:hypothetical protein
MVLRILVLAMAIPLGCLAQTVTLGLSSGAASPGSSVTLAVSLNATGATPSTVQWAVQYSTEDFSGVTVTAGPAATESGKTVSCNQQGAGTTNCILWGANATPIANGIIANVRLTVSASTLANSSGVQIVNCLGANPAGNALPGSGQGGSVTILQLITANPNPIPVVSGTTGKTLISWNVANASSVEVHVGSAMGTLFAEGGSAGLAETGDWVGNGTVFVLVDGTTHAVLAATTVTLIGTPTINAYPNPIPVAPGATVGQTTINWNAPGSSSVEVHIVSAIGPLFAEGGSTGSAQTGDWVTNGMVFVLVDATARAVLATTTVKQILP